MEGTHSDKQKLVTKGKCPSLSRIDGDYSNGNATMVTNGNNYLHLVPVVGLSVISHVILTAGEVLAVTLQMRTLRFGEVH